MPRSKPLPPEVSIVIPFFNAESFLEETLRSVLAQTFRRWELLLVDDGSTDSGAAISRLWASRDPARIRLLEHPAGARRGAFASRLLGARRARTTVIALLDADDVWERDYLKQHLRFWKKQRTARVALSYGPAVHWFPRAPSRNFVQQMPTLREAVFPPGALLQNLLSGAFATGPRTSCSLLRRTAILELAEFAPAARKYPAMEDRFLFWAIAVRRPIAVHTAALARFRQRHAPGAIPKSVIRRFQREESRLLPIIRNYLARHQPEHPLLGPEGIPARIKALRNTRGLPAFGDYFLRKIPKALLCLSHGSQLL